MVGFSHSHAPSELRMIWALLAFARHRAAKCVRAKLGSPSRGREREREAHDAHVPLILLCCLFRFASFGRVVNDTPLLTPSPRLPLRLRPLPLPLSLSPRATIAKKTHTHNRSLHGSLHRRHVRHAGRSLQCGARELRRVVPQLVGGSFSGSYSASVLFPWGAQSVVCWAALASRASLGKEGLARKRRRDAQEGEGGEKSWLG